MMKIIDIPQKWALPINMIFFNLSRLSPFRNRKLWIFGAWGGKKYDDNSRYLFEYVINNHSDKIHAVWIGRTPETVNLVRSYGYEAYCGDSLRGWWLQLKAGVAFYTNSLNDFGLIPLVGGAVVATAWHGMSFKKIYNSKYKGWRLLLKKILDHIYSRTYRTMSMVTSEWAKHWFEESFTLNPEKIFITGQPRNDAFHHFSRSDVLKRLGYDPRKKIILYLPTYRHQALGEDAIQHIVEDLYNDREFDEMLTANNYIFVAKPHYISPPLDIEERDNFVTQSSYAVTSNQELLACGDILVTDYSGGFIDFALLDRPVVFYTPDEEMFLRHSEEMDKKFFELSKLNNARNPHELMLKLANPSIIACEAINDVWEDKSIKDTCYSENVYNVLAESVGMKL